VSDVLPVTFAVLCCVASLLLARGTMRGTWVLSPLFIYVIMSILFINIGFILYYVEYNTHDWALNALLSPSIGLLCVALGGATVTGLDPVQKGWYRRPQTQAGIDITYSSAVVTGLAVFGVVGLYFALIGFVPLFKGIGMLFTGGFTPGLVNSLRVSRDPYINPDQAYIPLQGLMELIRFQGLPIVAVWFLYYFRRGVYPRCSLVMVFTATVCVTLTGQRWPLMYLLGTIIVFTSWTTAHQREFRRVLFRIFSIAIVGGLLLSALLGRTNDDALSYAEMLIFGTGDLFKRILSGNAMAPFLSYAVFPAREEWLLGESYLQNLISFLPGKGEAYPVTFNQLIMDNGNFTAPPDFYTEAYINFGWPGVVVISLLLGSVLGILQRKILQIRCLTSLSFAGLLVVVVGFSVMSGIIFVGNAFFAIVFLKTVNGGARLAFGLQRRAECRLPRQVRIQAPSVT